MNRIAIILLNWNSYEYTSNCIHSLQKCVSEEFDIIVVDNGSQDGSIQKLQQKFDHVIFILNDRNLGFAGGNNRGFEFALENNYEYVMMLNNDTFFEPNFLFHLVNYMDFHTEAGAIQSKIFFNDNRTKVWNGGSMYAPFLGWTYSKNYMRKETELQKNIHEVDWATGCALLLRTSVLREVGLLNEHFFMYYEDVDLSFRIKKAGYKIIFHPDSVVYHIAGMSYKTKKKGRNGYDNSNLHYLNFRNHLWLLRIWTQWYQWPTALMTYFSYSIAVLIYFSIRLRWKKFAAVCNGIYDGISKKICHGN